MIRIKQFDKTSYDELRNAYLQKIVDVVAFNEEDVLDTKRIRRQKKTNATFNLLMSLGEEYQGLKEFLFPNDTLSRRNLKLLLVGPEDLPVSLGGSGSYDSLRQYFEEIIGKVGIIEEPHGRNVKGCKDIFKYGSLNHIRRGQSENTAYWLQRQLRVQVCPYCNRMYTTTLYGKNRIRPDFDHFYPQSKYPYLSVSLFNLIPSCSMCNKRKGDTAEVCQNEQKSIIESSIIYPYDESFNESRRQISFRVIPNKIEETKEVMMGKNDDFVIELHPQEYSDKLQFAYKGGILHQTDVKERFKHENEKNLQEEDKIEVEKESKFWDRAKTSIDLLLIEDFYNEHKDEIMSLLRNHYQYTVNSIELIMKPLLNVDYPDASESEIKILIKNILYFTFSQQDEWGKSPLNKLKSDIIDQLNEIDNTRIN